VSLYTGDKSKAIDFSVPTKFDASGVQSVRLKIYRPDGTNVEWTPITNLVITHPAPAAYLAKGYVSLVSFRYTLNSNGLDLAQSGGYPGGAPAYRSRAWLYSAGPTFVGDSDEVTFRVLPALVLWPT